MPIHDPDKRRAYGRAWIAKRRNAWLQANGPCKRCGSEENLEVDHIDPMAKVSHRIWSFSAEKREAELAKCQVLCKACHRKKTNAMLVGEPEHGTMRRYNSRHYRCRCESCVEAGRAYKAAWRKTHPRPRQAVLERRPA